MSHVNLNIDLLARDLARLLGDMAALHAELAGSLREKLTAVRQADADRIQALTARELALAEQAARREGLRRQITRRILEGLGDRTAQADAIRLGDLAERFPEPRRSQLLTAAAGLKVAVEELQRMQRTHALITQEMLKHLGELVLAMRGGGAEHEGYSRGGRRESGVPAGVFEAVG